MLGANRHRVRGVHYLLSTFITQLRRVGRVYGNDPAAVLRHVVSEPKDEKKPSNPLRKLICKVLSKLARC